MLCTVDMLSWAPLVFGLYLIMLFVWEAWPRLLSILILWIMLCCWYIVIGYDCLLGTVPSTLCRLCIWLRESSHMHGRRICSVRLCVAVAFWYALWFLLLGVSSLCYVWMQIRARDWWTDRESMEGEDLYMWAGCSGIVQMRIWFFVVCFVIRWHNCTDYFGYMFYTCILIWTRGTPPLFFW